jgi:hypothetical protein
MNITSAKYTNDIDGNRAAISVVVDGNTENPMSVPLNTANRHYAEIMRQVEAGTLTIEEAE